VLASALALAFLEEERVTRKGEKMGGRRPERGLERERQYVREEAWVSGASE